MELAQRTQPAVSSMAGGKRVRRADKVWKVAKSPGTQSGPFAEPEASASHHRVVAADHSEALVTAEMSERLGCIASC